MHIAIHYMYIRGFTSKIFFWDDDIHMKKSNVVL